MGSSYLQYATGCLPPHRRRATYDLPGPVRRGPTTAPPGTGSTTAAGAGQPRHRRPPDDPAAPGPAPGHREDVLIERPNL